jgi:hypothetical protein
VRIILVLMVVAIISSDEHLYAATFSTSDSRTTHCHNFAGQYVCEHDEGHASGVFHTYDALRISGDVPSGRKIHVFLPRSYATSTSTYPVVYFNDGQSIFFPNNGVGKTWRAAEALDSLYASRSIPESIMVAVYPTDREAEYTHASVPDRPCCKLNQYADFLAQKLKPFIDQNYRTRPERQSNFIIGSSHGGLAAFFIAATHPQSFGGAGCLSSSFWVGMSPLGLPTRLKHSPLISHTRDILADPVLKPKLWIDWGLIRTGGEHNSWTEEHATRRGIEMAALLQKDFAYQDGIDLRAFEDRIGDHTEDSWARRLPKVLKFLLGSIAD